jgi:hypothetical protein
MILGSCSCHLKHGAAEWRWATTFMRPNPLSRVALPLLVLTVASTLWRFREGAIDVFDVTSLVGAIIILVLYRRRSEYAGSFLFWSTVPIYPIYFGSMVLGNKRVVQPGVLMVAGIVWVGGLVMLWRLRREYISFIRDAEQQPLPQPSPN